MGTLEGLLQEEQREVVLLQDSLGKEAKLLRETRAKMDQVSDFTDKRPNLDHITFNDTEHNVWK